MQGSLWPLAIPAIAEFPVSALAASGSIPLGGRIVATGHGASTPATTCNQNINRG